jgi:glycosyltransferase involved in cell wall biosynthesis
LKEKKYLLFFGTIGTLKGLLTIAEILYELLDKNRDLNFVLVGKEEGSQKNMIVPLLFKNAGVYKDRVFRFDKMSHSQLYPIIYRAYAVVLPSLIDNFPNACIEALAHGKIVIGTKDTGFEQLIENGKNGFLCQKDNPSELLNTIQKVLLLSTNEKLIIEKEALNSINKLSPQYIVPKLIMLYQKTIQNYNLNNGILKIEKNQEFFYSLIFRQLNDLNQIITDKQILINNILHSKSYRFGYFVIHPLVEFKQYSKQQIIRVKQGIKKRQEWYYLKRQIKFKKNNKKINLLFFIPWMVVGGADKVELDIISKLDKSIFSIHIITTCRAEHVWFHKFNESANNIWHLPEIMDTKFYSYFIKYLIIKLKINTILISNSGIGYEYLPLIKKEYPSIKVFDLLHGQGGKSENGGFPLFSSKFDKYINKRIVINNYLKKHIVENYNIKPHKISVIYNGIDIDYFNPDKVENDFLRNKFGLNHNDIIICFVGRLSEEKHPEHVIELAQLFKAEGNDRFYFFIAGGGNKYIELFQLIEKHNLNQHVFLLGELDDVRELLKDTDILYLSSEMEGLPIVVLEAMSMGVPVVASNVGGLPEMIDNGENGILVDYDSNFISNSKNAIVELLNKKKVIAQNNIKKAETIFSLEQMIKTYQKVILGN